MNKTNLIIPLLFMCIANSYGAACKMGDDPSILHPMENWDIIAGNSAAIKLAPSFSGIELAYSYKAKNNKQNRIKLDPHNGVMIINAETKDNFDVVVTAKNKCGSISMTFNVIVDQES